MSKIKENKVWLVTPIIERDQNGNATKLGYPEAVVTSRRKARGIKATLDTLDNVPDGTPERRVISSSVLLGW